MNLTVEPTYNVFSFFDTVGLLQGVALGLLLIVLNKKKYKSTFYLGLFLMLFAVRLLLFIVADLHLDKIYPHLALLPINFSWLLFPLFFVYTQKVSIFSHRKTTYWVLYPGIISLLVQLIIYSLPYETKMVIAENIWHKVIFTWAGMAYSWVIAVWNLNLLRHHKIRVRNYFSMIERKELLWAQVFLVSYLSIAVIYTVLAYLAPNSIYSKIFYSLVDLTIIYSVSYHGVVQRNVLSINTHREMFDNTNPPSVKETKELETNIASLENLIKQIDNYMVTSECFMHTELTIIDLAEALDIHPRRISTAINSIHNQNFNTYVNTFRVKKAEMLLAAEDFISLSAAGIGQEAGFRSKSAFYSSFKKVTGTTPTKYKEKILS